MPTSFYSLSLLSIQSYELNFLPPFCADRHFYRQNQEAEGEQQSGGKVDTFFYPPLRTGSSIGRGAKDGKPADK